MTHDPIETLSRGYQNPSPSGSDVLARKQQRRLEGAAAGFRSNPQLEHLVSLPAAEREAILAKLGPDFRSSYGYYLIGRDAARRIAKETQS